MQSDKSTSAQSAGVPGVRPQTSPTKGPLRAGQYPNSRDDSRREMFEQAGLTPEIQAELLKECIDVDRAGLRAVKENVITTKFGTEIVTTSDIPTRLRASDQLKATLGAYPSRAGDASGPGDVIVNVVLPDWAVSKPKPSTLVKVIDAQETKETAGISAGETGVTHADT